MTTFSTLHLDCQLFMLNAAYWRKRICNRMRVRCFCWSLNLSCKASSSCTNSFRFMVRAAGHGISSAGLGLKQSELLGWTFCVPSLRCPLSISKSGDLANTSPSRAPSFHEIWKWVPVERRCLESSTLQHHGGLTNKNPKRKLTLPAERKRSQ